jgi:hypothetical protein
VRSAGRWIALLALAALAGFALVACGGGGGGGLSTRTGITRTFTTETSTTTVTTTAPAPPPPPAPTPAASSSSGTPWGWIALGIGLALVLLIALAVWHRRRSGALAWGAKTADLNRRALVALDDVLAKGSLVTGQIEALVAEARSLEGRATYSTALIRQQAEQLQGALRPSGP